MVSGASGVDGARDRCVTDCSDECGTPEDTVQCSLLCATRRVRIRVARLLSYGNEVSYTIRKNPAKQDSPPAAGRVSDILPFRRSAILAERFSFIGRIFL